MRGYVLSCAMPATRRTPLLKGVVLDRHGTVLARASRMVLMAASPARLTSMRGVAEVTPALRRCPECYWLRIQQVGVLRIRALRFDPAPQGRSIFHFRVLSCPLRFPLMGA